MLNVPVDEPFMVALQDEILAQPNTQKHLSVQHQDGWFGHELHGIDGMDCHIGGLLNLGVEAYDRGTDYRYHQQFLLLPIRLLARCS